MTLFICLESCISAQNNNSDMQIIEMLTKFYSEYNAVWSNKPPLSTDLLARKLDSINYKYCTSKLRNEAKKALEGDYGFDLLTNNFPAINSFENLKVEKDLKVENDYIVSYTHIFNDISSKPVKHIVLLHVSVVKEGDSYMINMVK